MLAHQQHVSSGARGEIETGTARMHPSLRADFLALLGESREYRCRCITAECDGRQIAIGGLIFKPDGVYASVFLMEEVLQRPGALHRAVVRGLNDARRRGIREITAFAEPHNNAALLWLSRLGFKSADVRGEKIWIWRPMEH